MQQRTTDLRTHLLPPELIGHAQTAGQLAHCWETCAGHDVATCTPCAAIWRWDQLLHSNAGYVVGEGARYIHLCPACHNDLTTLVALHHRNCCSDTKPPD